VVARNHGVHSADDSRATGTEWADAALDYAALLREHIYEENNILFAMAERLLTQAEQQQLASSFAEVDTQKIGEPLASRLLQIAESLRSQTAGAVSK
jgi:hemerythrin-like domain-containing protein